MAHECEICGQECYCDMDDIGGCEQPISCVHFAHHRESGGDGAYDDIDTEEDEWDD